MKLIAALLPFGAYTPAFNAYNPNAYPVHKKISAEEWNSLWLSSFAQGNRQETILRKLINEDVSLLLNTVNIIIEVSNDHELRLIADRSTMSEHASKITALEQRMGSAESINGVQNQRLTAIEADIPTRALESTVVARVLNLQEQINTNETSTVSRVENLQGQINTNEASTVNRVENLQGQINTNKTNIGSIQSDYVRKQDNPERVLTDFTSAVSDTGAYVTTRRTKDIRTGAASAPIQEIPIPVVDNKARLFQPGEIETLRDLESWKESLLGMSLNYVVKFSDRPWKPQIDPPAGFPAAEVQRYLTQKWNELGLPQNIPDQSTLNDPTLPLCFMYYLNGAQWVLTKGSTLAAATNNKYNADGTIKEYGIVGSVVGNDTKQFYGFVESNGEFTINGLDDMETTLLNTKALAENLQEIKTDKYPADLIKKNVLSVGIDLSGKEIFFNTKSKVEKNWQRNRLLVRSSSNYSILNNQYQLVLTNPDGSTNKCLFNGYTWDVDSLILPSDFGIVTELETPDGDLTKDLCYVITHYFHSEKAVVTPEWNLKNKINSLYGTVDRNKILGIDDKGAVIPMNNESSRMTSAALISIRDDVSHMLMDVQTGIRMSLAQIKSCRKIDTYRYTQIPTTVNTITTQEGYKIPIHRFNPHRAGGIMETTAASITSGRNEIYFIPRDDYTQYHMVPNYLPEALYGIFILCTPLEFKTHLIVSLGWVTSEPGAVGMYKYIILASDHKMGKDVSVETWIDVDSKMRRTYDDFDINSDGDIIIYSNVKIDMNVKIIPQ